MLIDKIISLKPLKPGPYIARSASDKTDDWSFWYVSCPNGTTNYFTSLGGRPGIGTFTIKYDAEYIADIWNNN